jgi:hypothetical protein
MYNGVKAMITREKELAPKVEASHVEPAHEDHGLAV